MGEPGKRYRSQRDNDGDSKNQKRRVNKNDEKGSSELVVYRILCPADFIGSVIGKGGKVINSIRQETTAKVKVVDPFPGAKDRVLTMYCYLKEKEDIKMDDEFHDRQPLCPAQDALLRVHAAIANAVTSFGDSDEKQRYNDKVECRILVPSSQSANIIGRAGATIKKLRSKTRANIKVTAKDANDPTHSCAMEFDNFVLISGEPGAVERALFAVSAIMYKFAAKEEISLETVIHEAPPSVIIPSDAPIFQAAGFYPNTDSIIPPSSFPLILGSAQLTDVRSYTDTMTVWPLYSPALPVVSGFGGSFRSKELVIRVLCPFDKIGRVIGKGGATVKSIKQASGARIDVDDNKADHDECIITVTATESPDDVKSMAVEAVLLLQGKINDEDDDTVHMRLLVPSKVIGCIIGRLGSRINEIRKRTKAEVHISKGDKPKCADSIDELVEVSGEVASVRDALIQIVLRLRDDVLKDRDSGLSFSAGTDSLYPGGIGLSVPTIQSPVPRVAPLGLDQRSEIGNGPGMLSSSSPCGSYKTLLHGENHYASVSPYSSKLFSGLPLTSTLEVPIPAHAVGKVMGKGGQNLANIRRISGATVEISESRSFRGDHIALISGTSEQKRSAEDLIEAFMMAT